VRQHLRHIEHAAVRASDLTRQLLLFSRKQPMETEPVNLNTSVQSILTIIERLIGEDISIKVDLAPELHSVMADRTTIEQVIMNIVINARDAMPKGGSISIRTENRVVDEGYVRKYPYAKTGRHVCLTIEDTGEGMSSEVLKHIFEPFFTTKEQGRGTGLGLAVVYGIVKQHRGGSTWPADRERGRRSGSISPR
jgi:signal transduction histidine kinase